MKRLGLFLALVFCLTLGLAACSSSPVAPDFSDQPTQESLFDSTDGDPTDAFVAKYEDQDEVSSQKDAP